MSSSDAKSILSISVAEKLFDELQRTQSTLQSEISLRNSVESQRSRIKDECASLTNDLLDAQFQIKTLTSDKESLEREVNRLKSLVQVTNDRMVVEVCNSTNKSKRLEELLSSRESRINTLEKNSSIQTQEIQNLKAIIEKLKTLYY
eukprot:GDKK01040931.1.p1 GENE.GDKK01040931.1~~GDKK01040931.1.p1  ORF type:complete len:147 (+),score=9.77 GDKK01040931.1:26-466(+)